MLNSHAMEEWCFSGQSILIIKKIMKNNHYRAFTVSLLSFILGLISISVSYLIVSMYSRSYVPGFLYCNGSSIFVIVVA